MGKRAGLWVRSQEEDAVLTNSLRLRGSDPWYRESECGRMRIVKLNICGMTRYEVWDRQGEIWRQVRVNLPSYAEALKAAGALDTPEQFHEPKT